MQWYSLSRVQRVAAEQDIAADLARVLIHRPARQAAALRAADTRQEIAIRAAKAELERYRVEVEKAYESFLQFIDDLDFSVPIWPIAELIQRAIAHHNNFSYRDSITAADDIYTTIHICESFLWHDCSNYATLTNLYDGTREYKAICAQVKAAIDEAYPALSEQIKSHCCVSYTQPITD